MLVGVGTLDLDADGCTQKCYTTTRDNAFFDSSAGCVQSVINAVLTLFHFNFGCTTNADHGNTTGQLGQTLLQFFLVVVGSCVFDLTADLSHAAFDVGLGTATVNDCGVFLGDRNALGCAEHVEGHVFQLDAEVFGNNCTTGQDSDVFQHGFTAVTEARSFYSSDLQATAQLVDNQRCKRFAFNVFSNDDQRLAGLNNGFEDRQHWLKRGELLLVKKDQRVIHLGDHLVRVGDEVRRQVTAVELHAFYDFKFGFQGLGFFDGDDTFIADLVHGLGDHVTNFFFAVCGDGTNLCDLVIRLDLLGVFFQLLDNFGNCLVDTALEVHRVHAGGNALHAFANDGLCENRGSRGAVTCNVVRLGSDFAEHLSTHVLELVFQFDFLGNSHTIFRGARCAEGFFDHDVTTLGAERDFHSVGEDVHAFEHVFAGVWAEANNLGCHYANSFCLGCSEKRSCGGECLLDDAQNVGLFHDQQFFTINGDFCATPFCEENAVTRFDVERNALIVVTNCTIADGDDFAFLRLFLSGVRNDDAAFGFFSRLDATNQYAVV